MAQLTMFQFQPNTSVAVASIRTFCFSVLNIAIIYKATFVMPEIHSCSVHHSIYDHFCSDSTMSPWKLKYIFITTKDEIFYYSVLYVTFIFQA